MRKSEACLLIAAYFVAVCPDSGHALTSGPSLPEYSQFEQVDMTDMVNLASGSFTWSVPVMTVPGPALGFPLVLSYHANPGQKAEASWVGLGWNLQAGAITRQVNKIPDDFKDVPIYESITSSTIHGWSASISYNGVTVGISYHSLEGYGGTMGYDLLHEMGVPFSYDVTYGWGSASGMTGVSMGIGLGLGTAIGQDFGIGVGAGLSIGATEGGGLSGGLGGGINASYQMAAENSFLGAKSISASLASVGVSLSQSSGLSVGSSALGVGSSISVKGDWKTEQSGFKIPFYFGGYWTLGYSSWRSWIEGYEHDHYFGFLYDDAPGMGCQQDQPGAINCLHATSTDHKQRQEFLAADRELENGTQTKLMRTSEDAYTVTAQGVSGTFSPHRKEDGDYSNSLQSTSKLSCDWIVDCNRDEKNRTQELDLQRNRLNENGSSNDVYWRYADDLGGAEYTPPSTGPRNLPAAVSVQSKKINAIYSSNGKLTGFEVINPSGARYLFDCPLYNVWEAKYGYQDGDIDKYTSQEFGGSYAYAWLLTSVKSLDYVDLKGDGLSEDDLGGWVKITYGDGNQTENAKPVQYWATPYYDPTNPMYSNDTYNPDKKLVFSGPNTQTNSTTLYDDNVRISNSRSRALGLKEIAYIQKIETPTHEAIFTTAPRLDNRPFTVANAFDITSQSTAWDASITYNQTSNKIITTANVHAGAFLSEGIQDLDLRYGNIVDIILYTNYSLGASKGGVCSSTSSRSDSVIYSQVRIGETNTVSFTPSQLPAYNCYASGSVTKIRVRSAIGTQNASRRLTSIGLYEKAAIKAAGGDISAVKPISKVEFVQDYSLCYRTPNSYGVTADEINENPVNGKLTLKQLIISGDGTGETQLPPYRFYYGNNPSFQDPATATWVPWETGNWDRWGNRCSGCNDGYHEPDPYNPTHFLAAAWNLDRIVTPSGAELTVEYGPKVYSFVGTEPLASDGGNGNVKMLIASGGPEMFPELHDITDYTWGSNRQETWWFYNVPLANIRKKIEARKWNILGYQFEMTSKQKWRHVGFSYSTLGCTPGNQYDYQRAWIHLSSDACTANGTGTTSNGNGSITLTSCTLGGVTAGGVHYDPFFKGASGYIEASTVAQSDAFSVGFRPPGDFNQQADDSFEEVAGQDSIGGDFRLYAILDTRGGADPNVELSDGSVVREIRMREPFSNAIQTTHYTYEGGVTPSLPATYSDYGDDRDKGGRGIEFFRGSPSITYSKVTATINGKYNTEYYFLTSKDLPTGFGSVPNANGTSFVSTTITDMSALWGALWKKVDLDASGNPVRTITNSWGVNSNYFPSGTDWDTKLPAAGLLLAYPKADGQNYVRTSDQESDYKSYFGIQQTVAGNRYFNSKSCYVGDDCQANIIVDQVILKRALPAPLKTETIQQGLRSTSYTYFHDFRSGEPLKSRHENSDGSVDVTEKLPAYYQYPLMKEQNALFQEYATATYHYPSGSRSDFMQDEASNQATSTKLTIWRPYDRSSNRSSLMNKSDFVTYRQFQTFAWRDIPGASTAQHWIPDDHCTPYTYDADKIYCNDAMYPLNSRWVLTEQINRYDSMSHATDIMDARGVNQTTLYGHDRSHPVALLENTPIPSNDPAQAGILRAFYESFEGSDEFKAKLSAGTNATQYSTSNLLAKSGSTSLEVKNISGTNSMVCFDMGVLDPNREYQASAWYYDATSATNSEEGSNRTRPGIFLGTNGGCASEYHPVGPDGSGPVSGGGGGGGDAPSGTRTWKRIYTTILANQCPVEAKRDPAILCLYAAKGSVGKNVRYDEVRVKPGGARMSTFTYAKGKMTSSVDIREVTTFYEYDGLGNLARIRNDDGVTLSEEAKRIGQR